MALIGSIRKNSWILVVLIALGMGGFVLQSIVTGSNKYAAGNRNEIGEVNGKKINIQEFNEAENVLYRNSGANSTYSNKANLWNYFKNKALVETIADELGIAVGTEELLDLQFGKNLSPVITARFKDQSTGAVDRQQLNQIKKAIDDDKLEGEYKKFWAIQEDEIIFDRQQSKLTNLVGKAIYTPKWLVEYQYNLDKTTASIDYVKIPFDKIKDTDVKVTDEDIDNFIAKNKANFDNPEELRTLKYLEIPINPTSVDRLNVNNTISKMYSDFQSADNDSLFAMSHNGTFSGVYNTKDQLPAHLKSDSVSLSKGKIIGPYLDEGNSLSIAKVIDVKVLPDSVKARHILRMVKQGDEKGMKDAQKTIDSLKSALEKGGANFAVLAQKYSQDPGSAQKGGELGTFAQGMMVPEFNNVCFNGVQGRYYSVKTQFGVHLIYIDKQIFKNRAPKYKMAFVNLGIEPSQNTQDSVYTVASEILTSSKTTKDLEAKAKKMGFVVKPAPPVKENDFTIGDLGASQTSRDIVKWAYEEGTETGNISPNVYTYNNSKYFYNEKYVIVYLDKIIEKGLRNAKNSREELEMVVRNNLKGKKIAAMIKSKDLQAVADQFQLKIDTASNITFDSRFVPNMGFEPKIISEIFNGKVNTVAGPIVGYSGTFMVKPTSITKPSTKPDIAIEQKNQTDRLKGEISYRIMEELLKKVKVFDNRKKFF